jgi:ATP-binding cassette subfamily C (CFTR/MRP) protein 1
LSASHAFTSVALISLVTTPAEELLTAIPSAATSLGCFGRIQTHLLRPRRQDSRIHHASWDDENVISEEAIKLHDLQISTFHDQTLYPHSLDLAIPRGKITLVKGSSGCGKSTLLKAILGEVRSTGSITLGEERVAYCSQLPWFFAGSVQENICGLSGQPIDENWYTNVLDACALTGLRSLSPHTMSGGEKQRLQLARATYHRPGLVLLDDALSALDAKTEAWVCQRLLSKDGLLRKSNATIVFVTHSARYDSMADHVISIDEKHVVAKGLPRPSRSKVFDEPETEFLTEGTAPSSPVKEGGGSVDADVSIPILAEPDPAQSDPLCNSQTGINKDSGKKSQNTDGDFRDYVYYAKSVKPLVMVAFVASAVCQAVCYYMSQVVLRLWTADDSGHQARWLPAYLVLSGGNVCLFGCTCWIMFLQLVPDSAANLHKILLDTVLGAPYSFLAKTEVGVILNRFSQDMTLIDSQLPAGVLCTLVYSLWTIGSLALIATGSTWMALTIPVMLGVLFIIQRIYLRTSRRIRILELELRSPTYSHFLDTLKGLPVIRAFGWEHDFTEVLVAKLDLSQIPYYLLYIVQRWLILVLDLMVAALAVTAMTMAVELRSSTSPEALGLSLNNVLTFNQTLALLMQFWTQLEISLGAIRRTREFEATTPCEPKTAVVADLPSSTWPDHGAIEFRGLSAGYASGQLAVKEVSMAIRPGSKVALCGRSGSGKSTLLLTLLRMLEPQAGSVSIDGRDLQGIPHALLRERLFTIPQDPMLLQHSVRFNLDPQAEYDDSDLSSALSRVMLLSLLENRGGLDAVVMPDTFSHGQRQLFSLARVLLRKAKRKAETDLPRGKVLLLDEATSNIDRETEQVVQAVVAEEFQGFTILVIAHRLDTILDSDSIAVFDQARLVEFDSPTGLLARPSAFRDLYDEYISQAGL